MRKIAVSDAFDVLFQANPFAHVRDDDDADLVLGTEVSCVACNTGNRYWVGRLYGAPTLARIGQHVASCSGFTMGSAGAMGVYLARMEAEVAARIVPRLSAMKRENLMLAKGCASKMPL